MEFLSNLKLSSKISLLPTLNVPKTLSIPIRNNFLNIVLNLRIKTVLSPNIYLLLQIIKLHIPLLSLVVNFTYLNLYLCEYCLNNQFNGAISILPKVSLKFCEISLYPILSLQLS